MKSSIPVLLLILSASAFYFYINPGYKDITELRAEISQYETALADAQSLAATRDSLVTVYNNLSSNDLARLEKMFPTEVDTVRLAAEINSIGQKYGITISGFDITEQQLPTEEEMLSSPYRTLVVKFSFESSYESFTQFLTDLESNVHISNISEIGFREAASNGKQTHNLTLNMYVLSQ
jgi:Tfp pilus assembly protein PilO